MKGHRYKAGGWFGESQAHSLAAQGKKVRYNADKYMMGMRMNAHKDDMMMMEPRNEVLEDVTDLPMEVREDFDTGYKGFKLSDAMMMPGSLVKDAGSAIGDMVRFSQDVTRPPRQDPMMSPHMMRR